MASTVFSFAISGIDGQLIEVETDTMPGINSVSIVGLGDKAVKEARERLEAAILYSNLIFPCQKVIFNLAPSDMKKTGTHYDLAMAVGLLLRTDQVRTLDLSDTGFIGELSLNAHIRPVSGVLPMVVKAREVGLRRVVLAMENVSEARLVKGIDICGCHTLKEVIQLLNGEHLVSIEPIEDSLENSAPSILHDFRDVKGQEMAINFMKIAAAGGHNFLMIGPPGCGKSMIAKRIPTILPEMNENESLEVTKIYSIANLLKQKGQLIQTRPFRAPHHNASTNALIGGGTHALPGEISLAHNGVLFLDEIAEFSKKTLDSLRQPLEDQAVTITRVWGSNTYPANFMLVGAMNPCPCGYFGQEKCRCTDYEIMKYRQKLSGPIMDRMDIQKYVAGVDLFEKNTSGFSSAELRSSIEMARRLQFKRYENFPSVNCNAQLSPAMIKEFCRLDSESTEILRKAYDRFQYSGRTLHMFMKVARTIADLEGEKEIRAPHMRKSILCRDLEKDKIMLSGV